MDLLGNVDPVVVASLRKVVQGVGCRASEERVEEGLVGEHEVRDLSTCWRSAVHTTGGGREHT